MSDTSPRFIIAAWPEGTRTDDAPTCVFCAGPGPLNAADHCRSCFRVVALLPWVLALGTVGRKP